MRVPVLSPGHHPDEPAPIQPPSWLPFPCSPACPAAAVHSEGTGAATFEHTHYALNPHSHPERWHSYFQVTDDKLGWRRGTCPRSHPESPGGLRGHPVVAPVHPWPLALCCCLAHLPLGAQSRHHYSHALTCSQGYSLRSLHGAPGSYCEELALETSLASLKGPAGPADLLPACRASPGSSLPCCV